MAGIPNDITNQLKNLFVLELIPRFGLTYARGNVQFAPGAIVPLDKGRQKE
jgi:hypothetical protein